MFPALKNSYLHERTTIDPRIINRGVDLARENPTIDQFDAFPPFNRITSSQPCIPVCNYDVTRRPLPFGRWAMPKLRRELHSSDPEIVMQAIMSIADLVHDPERNYEAIKLRVPNRMADLLENENPAIRERVSIALTTMAGLLEGKNAIVKNQRLINNLAQLLEDPIVSVRVKATALIERLAQVWMVADVLVDNGFIERIIFRLMEYEKDEPCLTLYLRTLESLMYCNGKYIALENNFYEILLKMLKNEDDAEVVGAVLKNISILTQTVQGKEIAFKRKLLKKLYRYIHDDDPVVYENAACAMVFATIKSEAILKAMKLPNLSDRLLLLAKNPNELTTQKYCLQIMANLVGHRQVKMDYIENHLEEIRTINVRHDEHAERIKGILLEAL